MRTLKTALAVVLGLAIMLIMAANMGAVELHLLPSVLASEGWTFTMPLALIIVGAVFAGFALGLLMEYIREHKHRAMLAEKRAEIARLKAENAKLSRQAGVDKDELKLLAS